MTHEAEVPDHYVRDLLELMPDAGLAVDSAGTIQFVNAAAGAMLGYEPQELRGRPLEQLLPGSLRQAHATHTVEYFKRPRTRSLGVGLSLRALRKDGVELPVEIRLRPIELAAGTVVLASLRGISQSEDWYCSMFEQLAIGVVHSDAGGRLLNVNRKFCELLGYSRNEALSLDIRRLTHPEDIADSLAERDRILAQVRGDYQREVRLTSKSGALVWTRITTSLLRPSGGAPQHFISLIQDVTARKRADLKIRHLNRVYAVLSNINALIVRVRDREGLFREACRIAVDEGRFELAWLGVVDRAAGRMRIVSWAGAGDDYLSRIPLELADGDTPAAGLTGCAVAQGRAAICNDISRDERIVARTEALRRGLRSTAHIPLSIGGEVVGVFALYAAEAGFFDSDEMKLLQELAGDIAFALDYIDKAGRVDYLAYYDPLTGLANRTLFMERLRQYIQAAEVAGEELALVLADVVRLQAVNDSLGRQAGDALLTLLATRLGHVVGPEKVARVSGDLFAIVLQGPASQPELERQFESIWRDVFGRHFDVGGSEVDISAKAGIATFPTDGIDAEALLSCAEAALRKARDCGETHVLHSPEMTARRAEKLSIETRLRRALEHEEFVLHYQPQVQVQSGRITGAEALLRWQSPELGTVAPMQFIPILEETGLILDVGAWALSRAAQDHQRWTQRGVAPLRVAVNVSPVQLRRRNFVATVAAALAGGAPTPGIDLELTENLLIEDIEENIRKLKELRELGVAIAIDDFGTGYSSLRYLAKLPVQALKIDRSFIVTMAENPDTMALVQTIISLARSLDLKVIAEGVDSEEQAKLLRLLRCDEFQGYLFSPAVPFEQMTALLARAGTAAGGQTHPVAARALGTAG